MNEIKLDFYAVMNSDGQFFRRKGYGGGGETWVDDIGTARIYAKLGPARACVTYFANAYEEYPAPKILKLTVSGSEILDETERVQKAKLKKERDERRSELCQLEMLEEQIAEEKAKLKRRQEELIKKQKKLFGPK